LRRTVPAEDEDIAVFLNFPDGFELYNEQTI
jgi:hypothetical protein